jgi:urease accessory protein
MKRLFATAAFLIFSAGTALAHVGHGATASFAAGFSHPFSGADHIAAMAMVGLWAVLKGGRALLVWPAVFIGVMLFGSLLGTAGVRLPFVEPAIVASVVAFGILVALTVDLPLAAGAAIITVFALFHGYAHGSEVAENINGIEYMAGFAVATAALHLLGIGFATTMTYFDLRPAIRVAGVLCVLTGAGLFAGLI